MKGYLEVKRFSCINGQMTFTVTTTTTIYTTATTATASNATVIFLLWIYFEAISK